MLGFFAEYRLPLFIASAVLVVASFMLDRRKGAGLDIIDELDSELGEPEARARRARQHELGESGATDQDADG